MLLRRQNYAKGSRYYGQHERPARRREGDPDAQGIWDRDRGPCVIRPPVPERGKRICGVGTGERIFLYHRARGHGRALGRRDGREYDASRHRRAVQRREARRHGRAALDRPDAERHPRCHRRYRRGEKRRHPCRPDHGCERRGPCPQAPGRT